MEVIDLLYSLKNWVRVLTSKAASDFVRRAAVPLTVQKGWDLGRGSELLDKADFHCRLTRNG